MLFRTWHYKHYEGPMWSGVRRRGGWSMVWRHAVSSALGPSLSFYTSDCGCLQPGLIIHKPSDYPSATALCSPSVALSCMVMMQQTQHCEYWGLFARSSAATYQGITFEFCLFKSQIALNLTQTP